MPNCSAARVNKLMGYSAMKIKIYMRTVRDDPGIVYSQ